MPRNNQFTLTAEQNEWLDKVSGILPKTDVGNAADEAATKAQLRANYTKTRTALTARLKQAFPLDHDKRMASALSAAETDFLNEEYDSALRWCPANVARCRFPLEMRVSVDKCIRSSLSDSEARNIRRTPPNNEEFEDYFGELDHGQGIYILTYEEGQPSGIFFAGWSYDFPLFLR